MLKTTKPKCWTIEIVKCFHYLNAKEARKQRYEVKKNRLNWFM